MNYPRLLRTHWFNLFATIIIATLTVYALVEIVDAIGVI